MNNPVLILTRNNLELTKRCVASVQAQDIPTDIFIFDNGSTDGTWDWCIANGLNLGLAYPQNRGVSMGWNDGLHIIFAKGYDHALVIGNDTMLPRYFYQELLRAEVPFVTGVAVDNLEQASQKPDHKKLTPNPDFSAFLMLKECWETVGTFDERMKHYARDCDYHLRANRHGYPLWKAAVPFYHERSSTMRLAAPEEQEELYKQAHNDRSFFNSKWGCFPGTPQYEELFR